MPEEPQAVLGAIALGGVAIWGANVVSSVAIIFVNKILMSRTGFNFAYATTLSGLHFLACSMGIWAFQRGGAIKKIQLPMSDLMIFTAISDASIASLNLSLMLNSVNFYQISKLLVIPFMCLVECFWLGRRFSSSVILAVSMVLCGVAAVTVTNSRISSNVLGLVLAAISVLSSGMQQILCRSLQTKHKVTSNELLSNTAPAQALSLLMVGPFLDRFVMGTWVIQYQWILPSSLTLLASCSAAVLVNVSQFACLGRFSAVSYQVLGHSKTMLVLLGGWSLLGEEISRKQFCGILLAIAGMVMYGVASSASARPQASDSKPMSPIQDEANTALLSSSTMQADEQPTRDDGLQLVAEIRDGAPGKV